MVLAVGHGNVAERYVFWGPKGQDVVKKREGLPYCFLEPGFFKLVLYPGLPVMVFGHIAYVYGLYLVFTQSLWHTLIPCKSFNIVISQKRPFSDQFFQ